MHNNFHFLTRLAVELDKKLAGAVLVECYSQRKDEIIFGFTHEGQDLFVRADLNSKFSCLSFPDQLFRANKNTVDLFQDILGEELKGVRSYHGERALGFDFAQSTIVFTLFGTRTNCHLVGAAGSHKFKKNEATEVLDPQDLVKEIVYQPVGFNGDLKSSFPTFGPLPAMWFDRSGSDSKLEELFEILEYGDLWVGELDGVVRLSLVPVLSESTTFSSCIEALNYLYSSYRKKDSLADLKRTLGKKWRDELKKNKRTLTKVESRLDQIVNGTSNEEIGHLIMANLHAIDQGETEVQLMNFYSGKPITIKLKKTESPQKNAENYYRKAKNEKKEIKLLEDNLLHLQSKVKKLEADLGLLEKKDFKELKNLSVLASKENNRKEAPKFKTYTFQGWQIYVGRNSRNNDELTLKFAKKNDTWLHAKDVSGSHVVIKEKSGQNIPASVLEYAAQIAAWYSKRKTDTLCPVIYTPKKFVRKRKGDPAGAVIVEREQVILVEPFDPDR